MRTCELPGCNNKHYSEGLCHKHYSRAKSRQKLAKRFGADSWEDHKQNQIDKQLDKRQKTGVGGTVAPNQLKMVLSKYSKETQMVMLGVAKMDLIDWAVEGMIRTEGEYPSDKEFDKLMEVKE